MKRQDLEATLTQEIELIEWESPVEIDLNRVFGAVGLSYRAAVECYGVVDVEVASEDGLMSLKANVAGRSGDRAYVAVRASDPEGCSAVVYFNVLVTGEVGEQQATA